MSAEPNGARLATKLPGSWIAWVYNKILSSCGHPSAPWVLGVVSFTESCCFVIPPEVMQLPMTYADRNKAWRYAFITTATSVLGAVAGYFMGHWLWVEIQPYLFQWIPGFAANFDKVGQMYQENAVGALFLAAFTPIPFKVFTVAAGVYADRIDLITLVLTSIVGRGLRYYILGALVYFFGPKAQELIERHFKVFTIVVMLLGVSVIAFLKLRH